MFESDRRTLFCRLYQKEINMWAYKLQEGISSKVYTTLAAERKEQSMSIMVNSNRAEC
jgi:hypothetical protein